MLGTICSSRRLSMAKPVFLYATGTAFLTQVLGVNLAPIGGGPGNTIVANGKKYFMDYITNDPFWLMLDNQIWDARKIPYPASAWPMSASIASGVGMVKAAINALPSGTPFCLGGYSQGAAVMSDVYDALRTGDMTSKASQFKGAVLFGNPRRQEDFTAPGVTWSGAAGQAGTTTGGSGCFPTRLASCEYGKWNEYVNYDEVIAAIGTDTNGAGFRSLVGWLTGLSDPITAISGALSGTWSAGLALAQATGDFGHVRYPMSAPLTGPTTVTGTKTSYELALDFLATVATDVSAGPILPATHPSLNHPWTIVRPSAA